MYSVCISILNYNNGLKTVKCIQSILTQTVGFWKIVIIDNKSTDDSVQIISSFLSRSGVDFSIIDYEREIAESVKSLSDVIIIRSVRNGGYSYGNNIGIKYARSSSQFSHILIINNDLVLNRDFLEIMIKKHESFGSGSNSSKIALGATEYDIKGNITHSGFHHLHLLSAFTLKKPVFPSFKYIAGSCIFLGIEAPLMDESFFLYFDDIQYSIILKENNWLLESCENASFIHEIGYKNQQEGSICRIIFVSMKNFYLKNYPLLYPLVVIFRILLYLAMGRFKIALILLKVSAGIHSTGINQYVKK
jgi:GT2 family glycosyltransferase